MLLVTAISISLSLSEVQVLSFHCNVGAQTKAGTKYGNVASLTCNIKDHRADSRGDPCPPRLKCYITVSKTANSNDNLTVLYLKKALFPGVGVVNMEEFSKHSMASCDDFRYHSSKAANIWSRCCPARRMMLEWINMKGGLTLVGQPLDKLVNKMPKGYLRELYNMFTLTAPVNPTIGAPYPPSRQLITTWIVEAWDRVPEELCTNAWTTCSYKTKNELGRDKDIIVVPYSDDQCRELVRKLCRDDV